VTWSLCLYTNRPNMITTPARKAENGKRYLSFQQFAPTPNSETICNSEISEDVS